MCVFVCVCVCVCACVFILTCTCPCETDVMSQSHALASMRAAVGVGTQKILGKVHMAQLEIGGSFLPTSLSILEDQGMECLLGLDMLKRHRMYVRATHECKSMVRFPLHIKMRDVAYTHDHARILSLSLCLSRVPTDTTRAAMLNELSTHITGSSIWSTIACGGEPRLYLSFLKATYQNLQN